LTCPFQLLSSLLHRLAFCSLKKIMILREKKKGKRKRG
jgi:hypothetical protein